MNFLNPIWLFALAAISIPVVIHLWNIKPGKTLKVGSIALFSESSPKSSRSFKLLDILLLVLRCLLLVLIAFLLATPLWQEHLKAGKAKGWVLMPKENYNETYKHFKLVIDSATKQGYELHYFNKGFAKIDLKQLQEHPLKDSASATPANYWNLVKQLQHQIPASVKVEIFTPNSINGFIGAKPDNGLNINWHTYTPADSVSTWLADAWLTTNGSIRVMQGTATPVGTNYQYIDIKNGGQAGSAYNVNVADGAPTVSLNNTTIKVDTAIQHITIYDDKNATDAAYLKAALNAIMQLTQRKTAINIYHQPEAIPGNQDWIYWLSDKHPGVSTQKTRNLLVYQAGKTSEVNTWISNSGDNAITPGQAKVPLKKIISGQLIGNAIWADGLGNPVLTLEQGKTNTYHFYSRFNPAWSDLVWSDEFPKWMLALTADPTIVTLHDKRAVSNEQLVFEKSSDAERIIHTTTTNYTDLSKYLWVILVVIFLTERWLATRNKSILTNG